MEDLILFDFAEEYMTELEKETIRDEWLYGGEENGE